MTAIGRETPVQQAPQSTSTSTSTPAAAALAALRITTGFVFLWAFLDKTFGLGYATPSERAWINGGSPTKGFLSSLETGPLRGFLNDLAGAPAADWLFMLGLLGIGAAMMLGIGLRVAAVAGAVMMAMMWLAEWPPAAGSSNPVVDYHVVYAIVGVVAALAHAGRTWGLGHRWESLPLVRQNRWLV